MTATIQTRLFPLLAFSALLVAPVTRAAADDESTYECIGSTYIASIKPFAPSGGVMHELERVVVSTKADPERMVWELWSHRDGETWSERGLKDGTSRKGVRLVLRGFYADLSLIDLDKSSPERETGLDFAECWFK